jgi:hypothetical protein
MSVAMIFASFVAIPSTSAGCGLPREDEKRVIHALLAAVRARRAHRLAAADERCAERRGQARRSNRGTAPASLRSRAFQATPHDAYLALRRTVIGIDPSFPFRVVTFQESSSPFSS